MDAVLVGALTGLAAVVGVLLWQLLVRPQASLAWWAGDGPRRPDLDRWIEQHRGALRALRIAGAGIVFLLGFLTGLLLTFLRATAAG